MRCRIRVTVLEFGEFGAAVELINSELRWSDGCDIRQRFFTFIRARARMTQGCRWPKKPSDRAPQDCRRLNIDGLFAYQNLRRYPQDPPPDKIAYEAIVDVNKTCFKRLASRVRKDKAAIIPNKKPSVEEFYKADGGPTLIFYFPATADELNEVDNVTYDP